MQALAERISAFNKTVGRALAWLCLAMVLVTGVIVIERYWFQSGSIRMQESVTFMHALLFMLTAAYTLAAGDHVRVDVFYGRMNERGRAWVDLLGTLLLLMPFCLFLIVSGWDYVSISWQIHEASQEAGGLPYPFLPLMKSAIPAAAALLALQGLAIVLRSTATLRGRE